LGGVNKLLSFNLDLDFLEGEGEGELSTTLARSLRVSFCSTSDKSDDS